MRKNRWIIPVAALVILYIIARITGVVQFYSIPTTSNEPTIKLGGYLFASNLKKPKRFDFITYNQASSEKNPGGVVVKRVCGMPGDKVQLIDGVLFVNDRNADTGLTLKISYIMPRAELQKLGDDFADKHHDDIWPAANDSVKVDLESALFRSLSLKGHMFIDTTHYEDIQAAFGRPWTVDNFGPLQVPPGKYFVLGDNRHGAQDSRFLGFVDEKAFRETVFGIF